MSIYYHGSWLVLIGNEFGGIWIMEFCILFSYLVDNPKCWNLTVKSTLIISSVHVND